jgi:hypothetical protein
MEVANTPAYYDTVTILLPLNKFIVQVPEAVFLVVCDHSMNKL